MIIIGMRYRILVFFFMGGGGGANIKSFDIGAKIATFWNSHIVIFVVTFYWMQDPW